MFGLIPTPYGSVYDNDPLRRYLVFSLLLLLNALQMLLYLAALRAYYADRPRAKQFGSTLADRHRGHGHLEDFHAGRRSELLNDGSLSRITDEEMRELMINACDQLEKLLRLKEQNPVEYDRQIKSYNLRYCRGWKR